MPAGFRVRDSRCSFACFFFALEPLRAAWFVIARFYTRRRVPSVNRTGIMTLSTDVVPTMSDETSEKPSEQQVLDALNEAMRVYHEQADLAALARFARQQSDELRS